MNYQVITDPENPLCGRSYEEVLAAVQWNGLILQFVEQKTKELCLAAVQEYGYALRFIEEQTPELCLTAVKQNSHALKFVRDEFREEVKASL